MNLHIYAMICVRYASETIHALHCYTVVQSLCMQPKQDNRKKPSQRELVQPPNVSRLNIQCACIGSNQPDVTHS